MKINELKPGIRGISIEGTVESIAEPRSVNLKSGGTAPSLCGKRLYAGIPRGNQS